MGEKERSDLGFGDELEDFNPADWNPGKPRTANKTEGAHAAKEAAQATGFQSREPGQGTVRQRRRRTGRNQQLNIKTTPSAIDEFCAIADAMKWGLGETLENAIPLLKRQFLSPPNEPEK